MRIPSGDRGSARIAEMCRRPELGAARRAEEREPPAAGIAETSLCAVAVPTSEALPFPVVHDFVHVFGSSTDTS